MGELDYLRCLLVQMGFLVCILFNLFGRINQFPEVDSCRIGLLLDEVDQFLKVVFKVDTILN